MMQPRGRARWCWNVHCWRRHSFRFILAYSTPQANTMNDYGSKLLDAKQNSIKIQQVAISSILFGQTEHSHLSTDYEEATFESRPKKAPLKLQTGNATTERKVILFNSLGWRRSHLAKVIVSIPNVQVIGPTGESVPAQVWSDFKQSVSFHLSISWLFYSSSS